MSDSEIDNLILESFGDEKPRKSASKKAATSAKVNKARSGVRKSKTKNSKNRRKHSSDSDDDSEDSYQSDRSDEFSGRDDNDPGERDEIEKLPWGPDGFGDEEDRRKLMAMDEVQRELILSERLEQIQQIRDRHLIKERIKQTEGSSNKNADMSRRSNRSKAVPASVQSRQLSELKRRREEKSTRGTGTRVKSESSPERKRRKDRDRDRSSSYSRSSASEESESEDEAARDRKHFKKVVTLEELNRIWIPRRNLVKWMHLPMFEETVKGCFLRFNIGMKKDTGDSEYRVCEIVDVGKHHKVYRVEDTLTDKNLVLKHGRSTKHFPMDMVSNSPFTEKEYERWIKDCDEDGVKPILFERVQEMEPILQQARERILTNKDLDEMLKSKKALTQIPHNSAMQKADLIAQLEFAKHHGEVSKIAEYEEKLAEIEARTKGTNVNKLDKFAAINKRNRERDQQELRLAEQYEMERRKELATANSTDPFARRKTVPKLVHAYVPRNKGNESPVSTNNIKPNPSTSLTETIKVAAVSEQAYEIGKNARPMSTYEKLMAEQELDIDLDD